MNFNRDDLFGPQVRANEALDSVDAWFSVMTTLGRPVTQLHVDARHWISLNNALCRGTHGMTLENTTYRGVKLISIP